MRLNPLLRHCYCTIQYLRFGIEFHYRLCCVFNFILDTWQMKLNKDGSIKKTSITGSMKQRRDEGTLLTEDGRVPCERCFKILKMKSNAPFIH